MSIRNALFGAREVKKTGFIAQLSSTEVSSAPCEAYKILKAQRRAFV